MARCVDLIIRKNLIFCSVNKSSLLLHGLQRRSCDETCCLVAKKSNLLDLQCNRKDSMCLGYWLLAVLATRIFNDGVSFLFMQSHSSLQHAEQATHGSLIIRCHNIICSIKTLVEQSKFQARITVLNDSCFGKRQIVK